MKMLLTLALAAVPALAGEGRAAGTWSVTPTSASGPGHQLSGHDALWRAIELAAPGDVLLVQSGHYVSGNLGRGKQKPSGQPNAPIVVRGLGEVLVEQVNYGGSATLAVGGGDWVTFENFKFEASTSAINFLPDWSDGGHVGWTFIDCEIDGMWDWKTNTSRGRHGYLSKWGISSWSLSRFRWEGGSIHDVFYEHGMYHHNPLGDITIRGARIERVGRTAMQIRCPEKGSGQGSLPMGRGTVVVQDCHIADTGLADGGSSLTFAGRNSFDIKLLSNRIDHGFDETLRSAWRGRHGNKRFGTGAVVVWEEGKGQPNGPVTMTGNVIRYATGSGDRTAVKIGSAPSLRMVDNRIEIADAGEPGPHQQALVISPRAPNGQPQQGFSDVGQVELDRNHVEGQVIVAGRVRE